MWANAQRDGRPAEYRWRPLFNSAKFCWRPILQCRAITLPRRETRWNLQEWPKLPDRSQPLGGRSSPYCTDMWRRYSCLTSFYTALQCSHCKRCTSYSNSVCLSVCPSITRRYCVKTTARKDFHFGAAVAIIPIFWLKMREKTAQFAQLDSKMCLVL